MDISVGDMISIRRRSHIIWVFHLTKINKIIKEERWKTT